MYNILIIIMDNNCCNQPFLQTIFNPKYKRGTQKCIACFKIFNNVTTYVCPKCNTSQGESFCVIDSNPSKAICEHCHQIFNETDFLRTQEKIFYS